MNKDQLMQQRTQLMEMISQMTLNEMELKAQLAKVVSRRESSVEDLVSVIQELNRLDKEAASKEEQPKLEVVK